tara:strand:+ start:377 stop:676 length:300 start_codon:yes stop_codon:yes gene_type:complete
MDLSKYNFPEVTQADMAFPTFNIPKELLKEAESRELTKGRKKFAELFYSGGKIEFKKDVEGTWKENAFLWCRAMMGSWSPKHEHKEAVCAMIFEECLIL